MTEHEERPSGPPDGPQPPPASDETVPTPFPRPEIPEPAEPAVLPPLEEVVFEPRPILPPREEPPPAPTTPSPVAPQLPQAPLWRGEPRALRPRRMRTLALLAEALLPPGGGIPDSASEVGVAERVDLSLARGDPAARRLVSRTLALWEWLPLASRHLRPFSRLRPERRAAVLERAERGRSLVRRQALGVLKVYCVNEWASSPAVERALDSSGSCLTHDAPRDAPALEILSWPQVGFDHVEECDAVVVGSGAGGAVVAKELAEAGLSVVVLEEGGHFTRSDFAGPPWHRVQRLYRASGTTAALGVPPIPLPMGKAVGGTTLVNSGTCFRTPDRVLARWGSEQGIEGIDAESMRPHFERVERILRVKPVPDDVLGENARVFARGVEALGLHGAPLERDIEGCRGCGVCAFGCPSDAKQSTHISYLPRAQHHGATIYANTRAERILVEDGRARGVAARLLDPGTGEPMATLTVRAPVVVVSAGAIHSPALLAANALGNRSGMLGRNLRIHPAVGVGALFAETVDCWKGTLQSYYVDDFHQSHDVMIEVTSSVPSVGAGSFPGTGEALKDLLGRYRNLATAGLFVSDTGAGRVVRRAGREPLVLYRLDPTDARKMARGIGAIAEIFLAAGARAVITGIHGVGPVTSREEVRALREAEVRARALKPTAFHPAGTARMGADPALNVCDGWGGVHGVGGLFVADASMLPGCPTVNPMVSIMAFATRTAARIVSLASGAA